MKEIKFNHIYSTTTLFQNMIEAGLFSRIEELQDRADEVIDALALPSNSIIITSNNIKTPDYASQRMFIENVFWSAFSAYEEPDENGLYPFGKYYYINEDKFMKLVEDTVYIEGTKLGDYGIPVYKPVDITKLS